MLKSLAIVGAGRVGRALGRRLREQGWRIGAVVTRSQNGARNAVRFIGGGRACAAISREVLAARVIIIATPDDEIAAAARQLAELLEAVGNTSRQGKIFLHTSGALDATVLKLLQQHGASVGSMHPLQTFSGVGVPPLEGKYFAIEGDPVALRAARTIVRALGGKAVNIGAGKSLYTTRLRHWPLVMCSPLRKPPRGCLCRQVCNASKPYAPCWA